jgi:GT2 family glycosyltransferase
MLTDLTAVIAVKNRNENIACCVNSISVNSDIPKCIIVDFGSYPPVTMCGPEWLKVVHVGRNTGRFHKARALNIGLRHVTTKYVVFTDADQLFATDFFKTVRDMIGTSRVLAKCNTYFLPEIPKNIPRANLYKSYNAVLEIAKKNNKFLGEGCCLGCHTEHAQYVHGFDERFIDWGYEDCDFAYRLSLLGYAVTFIDNFTSMVHMPHAIDLTGHVQNSALFCANQRTGKIIANENTAWGEL